MYGTGNQIVRPYDFVQGNELNDPQLPGPPTIKQADFLRTSQRLAPVYLTQEADPSRSHETSPDTTQKTTQGQSNPPNQPPPPTPSNNQAGPASLIGSTRNSVHASSRANRQSVPLPNVPLGAPSRGIERSQTPPPPLPQQPSGNPILFYGQKCNFYGVRF